MFEKWYALDAGAFNFRLYNFSNGKEITMRTCLAYKGKELLAMSDDALEYVYHQKPSIKVKYPIQEGKILSDISLFVEKGIKELGNTNRFYRPCLLICLPERNAQIENEWVENLSRTGMKKFEFVSISDLLSGSKPQFFIHSGHSYTQMGLVINGKEVVLKRIHFAGQQIDEMVQKIVVQKTQCLISNEDARVLKENASKHLCLKQNAMLSCFAMNKYQKYVKVEVSSKDLWPAIEKVEKQIVLWAKECISVLGLDLQLQIFDNKVLLTGGMANCFGLKQYLEHELSCEVMCSPNPEYDIMRRLKEWK